MATKKKASRRAVVNKEDANSQLSSNRRAQERNARLQQEQKASADRQAAQIAQKDETPREGDQVTLDINGVPPALHTAALLDSLRSLNNSGMHGRSGTLTGYTDGPAGRMAIVNGPDFTHHVPVAALKRSDVFQREQNPKRKRTRASRKAAKKSAKKSVAKKAASK